MSLTPAVYGGHDEQPVLDEMSGHLAEEVVSPLNCLEHIVEGELTARHIEQISLCERHTERQDRTGQDRRGEDR